MLFSHDITKSWRPNESRFPCQVINARTHYFRSDLYTQNEQWGTLPHLNGAAWQVTSLAHLIQLRWLHLIPHSRVATSYQTTICLSERQRTRVHFCLSFRLFLYDESREFVNMYTCHSFQCVGTQFNYAFTHASNQAIYSTALQSSTERDAKWWWISENIILLLFQSHSWHFPELEFHSDWIIREPRSWDLIFHAKLFYFYL